MAAEETGLGATTEEYTAKESWRKHLGKCAGDLQSRPAGSQHIDERSKSDSDD